MEGLEIEAVHDYRKLLERACERMPRKVNGVKRKLQIWTQSESTRDPRRAESRKSEECSTASPNVWSAPLKFRARTPNLVVISQVCVVLWKLLEFKS
ncbi:hypothetical protein VNO77_28362 [Canavalia gladiata]|uniref:Uncharacterized protein n=1 Tax=Canavalia gladiata TaxID=3824 RepID=A0AAN9L095_CANGL